MDSCTLDDALETAVLAAVRAGKPSPIPLETLLGVSRATLAAQRALTGAER